MLGHHWRVSCQGKWVMKQLGQQHMSSLLSTLHFSLAFHFARAAATRGHSRHRMHSLFSR